MSVELKEAAQQALKELGEARKIVRASSSRQLAKDWDRRATDALANLRTAIQQPAQAVNEKHFGDFELLVVTTAYEQGFGHAFRTELSNPYAPATNAYEAWDMGRSAGKRNGQPQQPATAIACGIPGMAKTTCPYCEQGFTFEHEQPVTGEPVASRNPFASRCYTMSESHLSGHRLIVGFEKLEDAQAAHEWIARHGRCDYLHHGITAQATQATPRIPSDGPSTYAQRFTAAVAVICGVTPPAALVCDWINKAERHDDLQQWVGSYAPGWVQNIAVLDAAHQMADQPTEGGNHEPSQQPTTTEPVGQVSDLFPSVRNKLHAKGFDSDAPLYTRPSPGVSADVIRDAEWYRLIRDGSGWPAVFAAHDAPEPLRGDDLDDAIAAAMPPNP